jgi:hypothetical protein
MINNPAYNILKLVAVVKSVTGLVPGNNILKLFLLSLTLPRVLEPYSQYLAFFVNSNWVQ